MQNVDLIRLTCKERFTFLRWTSRKGYSLWFSQSRWLGNMLFAKHFLLFQVVNSEMLLFEKWCDSFSLQTLVVLLHFSLYLIHRMSSSPISCLTPQIYNTDTDTLRHTHTQTHRHTHIHYESCSVVFDSLRPHGLYSPWNSPGQNTGVGSLNLLQGSSWPRNRTGISCIAGRFFSSWATQGSHIYIYTHTHIYSHIYANTKL